MPEYFMRASLAACASLLALPFATPAAAQATRTWVSGVGDDVNPCSRAAPCKTFAGAVSKTAWGGEINCLDGGGFGAVTITKSIAIICDDTFNGVLVTGANAITVNAADYDVVFLSGFDFEGFGTGVNAVRFLGGGGLLIRNSTIRNFRGTNGFGINFTPTLPAARLVLDDVTIVGNGASSGVTGGVMIQPAVNASASFTIVNSRVTDNNRGGIRVDASADGASVKGMISSSVVSGNQIGLYVRSVTGGGNANVALIDTVVNGNSSSGVLSESGAATVSASRSTITDNGNGVRTMTGGNIVSFGDNVVAGNNNNGVFTVVVPKQ